MLAVFLNRCRRMKDVREDGVWWRFLDPNASWVCPYRFFLFMQGQLIGHIDRGYELNSRNEHTKECVKGTATRHSKSQAWSRLPPNPVRFSKIEISRRNVSFWNSNFASRQLWLPFRSGPHNPRPSIRALSFHHARLIRGRLGPIFHTIRGIVERVRKSAARVHGEVK